MATKKEIFEGTVSAVIALCDEHKVANKFRAALSAILEDNLAPKAGGATVNIDEVTKKDADGNITHILCSVSSKFLPATEEFFYAEKNGKGINGLKRVSKQGESIKKAHNKQLAATEKAIMTDVLDGVMTPEQGKAKLEKAKLEKPDFSSVTDVLPSKDEPTEAK